jgi:hypothetical protein
MAGMVGSWIGDSNKGKPAGSLQMSTKTPPA